MGLFLISASLFGNYSMIENPSVNRDKRKRIQQFQLYDKTEHQNHRLRYGTHNIRYELGQECEMSKTLNGGWKKGRANKRMGHPKHSELELCVKVCYTMDVHPREREKRGGVHIVIYSIV